MQTVKRHRISAVACLGCLFWLLPGAAHAQQCVGFSDVSAADTFCPNIEWIKNRAITLGCGPGLYCPTNAVPRNQMAAFMNRLGLALTPTPIRVNANSGPVALSTSAIVCPMPSDIAATTFPRTLATEFYLTGDATSALGVAANVVSSTDGGTTWINLPTGVTMRNETGTTGWMQIVTTGNLDLSVGASLRLGVRLSRVGSGTGDFADSWCQLSVQVLNRNSLTPPL